AVTVVACDQSGSTKYLLDVAKVVGTDVRTATANRNPQISMWQVDLSFTASGQNAWTNLTKEAYDNTDNRCATNTLNEDRRCAIAIVLDNAVISARSIIAVIPGDATIGGGTIDQAGARILAALIGSGSLP